MPTLRFRLAVVALAATALPSFSPAEVYLVGGKTVYIVPARDASEGKRYEAEVAYAATYRAIVGQETADLRALEDIASRHPRDSELMDRLRGRIHDDAQAEIDAAARGREAAISGWYEPAPNVVAACPALVSIYRDERPVSAVELKFSKGHRNDAYVIRDPYRTHPVDLPKGWEKGKKMSSTRFAEVVRPEPLPEFDRWHHPGFAGLADLPAKEPGSKSTSLQKFDPESVGTVKDPGAHVPSDLPNPVRGSELALKMLVTKDDPGASSRPAQKKGKREPTGVGDVYGHVVDAETNAYLQGAKVELVVPDDMKAPDRSSGESRQAGYYSIRAPIGAVSSRLASERLMTLSIASVLMGGAQKIDKFVNASAFVVRVSKPGYKTFEGPLRVVGANPKLFNAWLECVRLAPESAPYASSAADYDQVVRFDRIEATPIVSPGAPVDLKIVVANAPLVDRKVPDLAVYIAGTMRYEKLKGKSEGGMAIYSGKVMTTQMRLDVGGLLTNATRKLPPGIKCLEFSLGGETLALARRPSAVRVIAVAEPGSTPPGIADLVVEADASLEAGKDATQTFSKIERLWPDGGVRAARSAVLAQVDPSAEGALDEDNVLVKAAETIRAGHPSEGWATISKFKSRLPEIIATSFEAAISAQESPANFKARATLARNARSLAGTQNPFQARLRDCLLAQPLALLPTPQTPQDRVYCASILMGEGKFDEALAILDSAKQDSVVSLTAKTMIAQCLRAKGERKVALADFDVIMATEEGKKMKAFYAHLDDASLLFDAGRFDEAEAALVRTLALGRGTSVDFSAPSSLVPLGGTVYSVYNGPVISGTVGYAYPEAAAAQRLLFYYDALVSQEEPSAVRCLVARSLADIGSTSLAERIANSLPADDYVLLTRAYILKAEGRSSEAKMLALQVSRANPKNVEAMLMSQSIR